MAKGKVFPNEKEKGNKTSGKNIIKPRVQTRSRSKSTEVDRTTVTKCVPVNETGKINTNKRKSEGAVTSNVKVARKIDFSKATVAESEVRPGGSNDRNEIICDVEANAVTKVVVPKKRTNDSKYTAKSDPNAFNESVDLNDGVLVNVDPIEDHEFGAPEYDYEEDQAGGHMSADTGLNATGVSKGHLSTTTDNVLVSDMDNDGEFNVAEYQALMKDKTLMKVFNHLVKEKVEEAKQEMLATATAATAAVNNNGNVFEIGGNNVNSNRNFDVCIPETQSKIQSKVHKQIPKVQNIKSPSDTTLYAPAVHKLDRTTIYNSNKGPLSGIIQTTQTTPVRKEALPEQVSNEIIRKISDFVESIRMNDRAEAGTSQNTPDADEQDVRVDYLAAKERSEQAILDAEKYKAVLADPPGETHNFGCDQSTLKEIRNIGTGISDDDFFHLTCHVDSGMIAKIEKGEFIDLEKLLPKDKNRRNESNRMEWIHSEGSTYLAPVADRAAKISNFRRWEQAFRIYSTIYCGANPHRSKEVWQYISVISTASSAYVWDNVYDYDMTFRHLMAFNPNRSWAVTYNQMWNLCMKEPLQNKFSNFQRNGNSSWNSSSASVYSGKPNTGHKKKKTQYYWNFNRGLNCKYGKNCRFIEHCKFCDDASHGINTCSKCPADKKDSFMQSAGNSTGNSSV